MKIAILIMLLIAGCARFTGYKEREINLPTIDKKNVTIQRDF